MRVIAAKEHGLIPLRVTDSTRVRRDVLRRGWVDLRTGVRDWDRTDTSYGEVPRALYAGSMAGLLPLSEDVAVLVEPRFPAQLTAMVNAVGRPEVALDVVRAYGVADDAATADWMLDHIVGDFIGAAEAVTQQGLHREYVERRSTTSSPKGRILAGPTMMLTTRGIDFKAHVAYHERTDATPPNQALVEALHWCLRWTAGRRDMRGQWKRVVGLLHTLRFVERDPEGQFRRARSVQQPLTLPESRSAYRRALPLAVALLERRGFSLDAVDGDLALSSLLVETDTVFEEYVRKRLSDYLPDRSLVVVDGNTMRPKRMLYTAALPADVPANATVLPLGTNNIQPDILIERGQTTLLVIDVKYKPITAHADREDVIEQLVTYAHRLDCGRAVSIHPTQEGQSSGLFVSGRVGTTTLYNYRVNIGAPDIEDEMRTMAKALVELC